ncbi:MAG: FHA domain-containing protein [Bacteroidaceae bacterium]|nr:FHA domain-containing protein [Bacteroidaceae bacterium]
MGIGDEIIIGRMGQQAMPIADANVDPQHAILRMTAEGLYQIEDNGSTKGIFIFGMRIKRKTVKADTPILLGSFKTSVQQLLDDVSSVDLGTIWTKYDAERRLWDRKAMFVNYLRILPSFLTMLLGICVGQGLNSGLRMGLTAGLTIVVLIISMVASDKIMAKKNLRMAELNAEMQVKYICPHCHRFLGSTPYIVLKQRKYCPICNFPLP